MDARRFHGWSFQGLPEIMTEQGVVSADSLQVDVASDEICASGNLTIHEGVWRAGISS